MSLPARPAAVGPERARVAPLRFGTFAFDPGRRLLSRDGQELPLPPRVLGVLELLLHRAGDIVPRQELIDAVWKDAFVTDTSLAEAVSVLRQALGDDPQAPTYIQTLHRRGYRFVAPIAPPVPIEDVSRQASSTAETTVDPMIVSPSIVWQLLPWSTAAICALLAIAAVWQLTQDHRGAVAPAARFTVTLPSGVRLDEAAPSLAISPDGALVAWSGCEGNRCQLYQRPLDRLDAAPVAGTDNAQAPFFSPDGRWIAYFADGRLKKVAIAGGVPVTIADAPAVLGGVWIDREIIFAGAITGGLQRVSADGGDPRPLTTPNETDGEVRHAWPALVPDTRVLIFSIETTPTDAANGVLSLLGALSLDATGSLPTRGWRTLVAGVGIARAAAPDAIVFSRGSELHAVAFDPLRLATAGAPRVVLSQLATSRGRAHYALSTTGALVAATTASPASAAGLTWWTTAGVQAVADESRRLIDAVPSPDGTQVAGVSVEGPRSDIWVADVRRGAATRLTHSGVNASPIWSADGRTIYFATRTDGRFEIWSRDADGARPVTRVFGGSHHALPLAVSPDGRQLALLQTGDRSRADLWSLPLDGGEARPLVQGPFDDVAASFSPDSTLVAFQSADAGRWEIYVQRLRDGRRLTVSTDGGERPVWARDGLYFQSRGHLVRAAIASTGEALRVESVTRVGDLHGGTVQGVAPDGRVLVERSADLTAATPVVSLEWRRELRALLGPPSSLLPR